MTNAAVFVDVEQPIRDWLRGQSVTGVGARCYVGLPQGVTYPAISLALLDGGIDLGEAPIANALVSFSVWAATRPEAQAAAWSLVSKIQSLRTVLMSTAICQTAQVTAGPTPRTEPDGFERFVIDAVFCMKAAT